MESNVVESAGQNAAETTSTPNNMQGTTEQTQTSESSTCTSTQSIGIAIGAVVAIIVIALVCKKRMGSSTQSKSTHGKSRNSSDIVEIYVGNLSYDMNDAQLRKEFERFGVVKSARVITHRTNGKSKGYGFVEMPHRKEALIAIKALENSEVMGRRIRVNEARANTRPADR